MADYGSVCSRRIPSAATGSCSQVTAWPAGWEPCTAYHNWLCTEHVVKLRSMRALSAAQVQLSATQLVVLQQ
jgi:hypothetical protein